MNTDNNDKNNKKSIVKSIVAGDNYSLPGGAQEGASGSVAPEYEGEWINIIKLLKFYRGHWKMAFINEDTRTRIQFFVTYVILGLVSLGMTVLNAYTEWALLGYVTFAFTVLSFINIVLCMISEKAESIARLLFGFEIIGLFTFFAIVGHPEGFSILWTLILPSCGMLLFRAKYGSIVAGVQWGILAFLFWTEAGQSILLYDYTQTFLQRFPLLYLACFAIGFFFEYIRSNTHAELVKARQNFEYLYKHDALTGLYNRYGLNAELEKAAVSGKNEGRAFAIADLDFFKRVNDTYGHLTGDKVLKTAASIISSVVGTDGYACRWGGEEFSVVFFDETKAEEICWRINKACGDHVYNANGIKFHITISVGLVLCNGDVLPHSSKVITQADDNLYTSKTTGRNKVTTTVINNDGTPQPGTPVPGGDTRQAS